MTKTTKELDFIEFMDDVLDDIDIRGMYFDKNEIEAKENALRTIASISVAIEELELGDVDQAFPKLSFKKGVFGDITDDISDYVTQVRGRARLRELTVMMTSLLDEMTDTGDAAIEEVSMLTECSLGSISKAFADEEYAKEVSEVVCTVIYAMLRFERLRNMAEGKYVKSNRG